MKLLLDTCTFLWLAADDAQLSSVARSACRDPVVQAILLGLSIVTPDPAIAHYPAPILW